MKEETKVENKSEKNMELHKKLFNNIVIALIIMIYFIFINLGSINIEPNIFWIDIKVFSMIILGISIIIFEKAYKKDSDDLAIYGIEVLILACHTLSINHVTNIYNLDFKYYILTSSYFFAIYYVLKDILIYTKENRKRLESLSDISDIVKKEKPSKKEAKKKAKVEENITIVNKNKIEEKEKEVDKKEEKAKITKEKKSKNNSKKETKTIKPTKKTENSKKIESDKEEKLENNTAKKTTKTTKKEKVEKNQEVENPPQKKRNTKRKGGIKDD